MNFALNCDSTRTDLMKFVWILELGLLKDKRKLNIKNYDKNDKKSLN